MTPRSTASTVRSAAASKAVSCVATTTPTPAWRPWRRASVTRRAGLGRAGRWAHRPGGTWRTAPPRAATSAGPVPVRRLLPARRAGRGGRRRGRRGRARSSERRRRRRWPAGGVADGRDAATVAPSGLRALRHPGQRRRAVRAGRGRPPVRRRSRLMAAGVGASAPRSTSSRVDFPAPLGPRAGPPPGRCHTADRRGQEPSAPGGDHRDAGGQQQRLAGRDRRRCPSGRGVAAPAHRRDLDGRAEPAGGGVERGAHPPDGQQALGGEQEHHQRHLQGEAAVGEPDAERHGHQRHRQRWPAVRAPGPTGTRRATCARWPGGSARSPRGPGRPGPRPGRTAAAWACR